MLTLQDITVSLGGNVILDRATAAIPPKSRVGLVGRNGAGKSTLLKVMTGQIEPDGGSFSYPNTTRVGYLAQDAPGGSVTPIETVLAADKERLDLLAEAETAEDPHRIADIHDRLTLIDAHGAPARAARILAGLGFDEATQNQPMDSFSGGWRMRVSLARALYMNPTFLILDEPTNHLDLEACVWLESKLAEFKKILLMVSHSQDFLNNVCTNIIDLQ